MGRDLPSHPLPLVRQAYIVRTASPEARCAEVSITGEREANVPSAGEQSENCSIPLRARLRPDSARVKLNYMGRDTMNRRSILSISAMTTLGMALLPSSSMAQQKSLKDQLVGTWVTVSAENTARNGGKQQLYGAMPNGALFLDASGRFALVIGRSWSPEIQIRKPAFVGCNA